MRERAAIWKEVSMVRAPTGYCVRNMIMRVHKWERKHIRNYSRMLKYVDTDLGLKKGA